MKHANLFIDVHIHIIHIHTYHFQWYYSAHYHAEITIVELLLTHSYKLYLCSFKCTYYLHSNELNIHRLNATDAVGTSPSFSLHISFLSVLLKFVS